MHTNVGEQELTSIWNRATDSGSDGQYLRPGDEALRDALAAHSALMNGGLSHCLEFLGWEETERAISGFTYFGCGDVASVLRRAADVVGPRALSADDDRRPQAFLDMSDAQMRELERLEDEYSRCVPSDNTLDSVFRQRFAEQPQDFAPAAP